MNTKKLAEALRMAAHHCPDGPVNVCLRAAADACEEEGGEERVVWNQVMQDEKRIAALEEDAPSGRKGDPGPAWFEPQRRTFAVQFLDGQWVFVGGWVYTGAGARYEGKPDERIEAAELRPGERIVQGEGVRVHRQLDGNYYVPCRSTPTADAHKHWEHGTYYPDPQERKG